MRIAIGLLLCALLAHPDVVRLGEGRQVKGKVLKETEETLFVDLGFTVLAVPKKAIVAREEEKKQPAGQTAAARHEKGALFATIEREETTVKGNVVRTAPGVVRVLTPSGSGSGFLITPDGYLVTNDHVVQGETKISVVLFEKDKGGAIQKRKIGKVRIVATNPVMDLALLKLEGVQDLPIVYLGDADEVRVGQTVFAIGNPLGLERTVSEGIVSTLTRVMDGQTHIQTTTPINPGNSGGPLFNLNGEVIGVVDLGGVLVEGLNFAIPVNRVKRFLKDREAYAYDKDSPNTGYRYLSPPPKPKSR